MILDDLMLECDSVGKRHYDRWIIKDISFKLSKGKTILIAGPSGAGKSTLINIISGILRPDMGRICVHGYNSSSHYEYIKSQISCVWNENSLFPNMSVIDNLRFFSSINKMDGKQADIRLCELLYYFGIFYDRNKFVRSLSSGTQRKVDLCRALIKNSELLLLDEPSSLLDNKSKKALLRALFVYKTNGKTMIIVSHHASLYSELIDDLMIMKNGKMIYHQPIENVIKGKNTFNNGFILKTSNRILANKLLQTLPEIENLYVSQKAIHISIRGRDDLSTVLNALTTKGLTIKEIISKKPNLDKLVGEIVNAY